MIRAIDKYYEGDLYVYDKPKKKRVYKKKAVKEDKSGNAIIDVKFEEITTDKIDSTAITTSRMFKDKEINLLGNLNTDGGGEQSLVKISEVLKNAGWKVNLHPWDTVHDSFKKLDVSPHSFKNGMEQHMVDGIPLLFYANDCVWDFPKNAQGIVKKSSALIVGINFMLGNFKKPAHTSWMNKGGKFKAVVFQNEEKLKEWENQVGGLEDVKKIVAVGAIDLNKFYEVCTPVLRFAHLYERVVQSS
jgi:hypothetical protein